MSFLLNNEVNVLLLAAGLGTRLRPLTEKYPKPCVPFLNVPMGLYQFQYLNFLNICKFMVNTFHLPEKIQNLYQNQPFYRKEIVFSNESGKILGGAGGLKKASAQMKKNAPILLMNADEVYFTKNKEFLKTTLKQHIQNKNLATISVIRHPEAGKKFGAIWSDGLTVQDISKTAKHTNLQPWHCIGPIFLSWDVLNLIPDGQESNIFYDVLIHKLVDKKVEIAPIEAVWYETGNPVDYFHATYSVLNNLTPEIHQFLNKYDKSVVIKNAAGLSFISNKFDSKLFQLAGTNVISKTSARIFQKNIEDSVLFDSEILNKSYFNN